MLVVMDISAGQEEIDGVVEHIGKMGLRAHPIPGATRTAIGITGNKSELHPQALENLPGVKEVISVSHAYKLVSRETHPEDSVVSIGGVDCGGDAVAVIAGPCAVESESQVRAVAEAVREAGVPLMRGGAYKPRTSPYSFQGLGEKGLELLAGCREEFGLPVITEAIDLPSLKLVEEYADAIQIGARNMQNFSLLRAAGQSKKPVLLKRGMSATLEEFLLSAEYILSEGNYSVILCERGVRTFADHTRNTLDLSIVPAVKRISHLPIIVDPSHGTGKRNKVRPLSRAGVAVGADGLIVEVHNDPDTALSDGPQSIVPDELKILMNEVRAIADVIGRSVHPSKSVGAVA